jgi:hypothetical protein
MSHRRRSSDVQVAMERFLTVNLAADSPASQRIRRLWREYEDRQTPEARFVKDLDLFELGLQGVEYEDRARPLPSSCRIRRHGRMQSKGWSSRSSLSRRSPRL